MKPFKSSTCPHSRFSKYHYNNFKNNRFIRFLFTLTGLVCLVWWLVRVIPKPSRAEYPCMKVAAPIASGFLLYIITLVAAVFSFKKARTYFRNSQYILALIFVLSGAVAGLFTVFHTDNKSYAHSALADSLFVPTDSANSPIGTAKGRTARGQSPLT